MVRQNSQEANKITSTFAHVRSKNYRLGETLTAARILSGMVA